MPGKIISVDGNESLLRTGKVDFSGVSRHISLAYLPEAQAGDYVIVHAGFAIAVIDEEEAQASLTAFQALDQQETEQ